jgi:hypothetical protein
MRNGDVVGRATGQVKMNPPKPMQQNLVDDKEAAEKLGMKPVTLRSWRSCERLLSDCPRPEENKGRPNE